MGPREIGPDADGGKRRLQAMGGCIFVDANDEITFEREGLSWFVGWGKVTLQKGGLKAANVKYHEKQKT